MISNYFSPSLSGATPLEPERMLGARAGAQYREIDALASAARTVSTASTDIAVGLCRGLAVRVDITVASGTGGLTACLQLGTSGSLVTLCPSADPAQFRKTTGKTITFFYPGAIHPDQLATDAWKTSGDWVLYMPALLTPVVRVFVLPDDASSYTYSAKLLVF